MSATNWTDAQLSAINTRGKTLLVSAAAGSGKTATLTERIIRSITREQDPADLSRLLIVTFTRAAASDLKTKISKALADALAKDPANRHLASQVMLLESAHICTIDSFYNDILKNNFHKLSLPGSLRIADSAELALLYRATMDDTIDRFYAQPWFERFADHFADVKSIDRLTDIFLSMYEDLLPYQAGLDLLLDYEEQLKNAADRDFFETPYGKTAYSEIIATLSYMENVFSAGENHFEQLGDKYQSYLTSFRHDKRCVSEALELVRQNSYDEARAALLDHAPISIKGVRGVDDRGKQLTEMRSKLQKKLASLKSQFFSLSDETIANHMMKTAEICHNAHTFLSEFDAALTKEKITRGICDFSDIRRFVMKLIVDENGAPSPLALELRERFDEIYIDEYQDTDQVQDLIFRTIAKPNNRFMVGDIKQSIYGFRGAAPSIFAGYKRSMPLLEAESDADERSIFMSNNFRCDENIIHFSNLVSSYLFKNCGESIEYSSMDDLIFSKKRPYDGYQSPKVTVAAVQPQEDDDDPKNAEARYLVNEIGRLIREEKKADGSPILPGDIAILMRGKGKMADLVDMLKQAGIPACSSEERSFFENPDVLLMLSFLSTVDNPQRDIPLSGTLCSPFYGFSLEDLVILRTNGDSAMSLYDAIEAYAQKNQDDLSAKCNAFLASLSYWRDQAQALPVDKLLRKLYRELSVLSMQGAEENNLIRLYEYARKFESGGFRGLYGFVRYINEIIELGTEIPGNGGEGAANAVQLITIHHSKGLEFPVCFIFEAGKKFNTSFIQNKLQFNPAIGIGVYLQDDSGLGYYDTPVRQAIINEECKLSREEEMRVLYVAMTRARERLYVTGTVKNYQKMLSDTATQVEFGSAYGIINAKSYLEWVLAAITAQGNDPAFHGCFTLAEVTDGLPVIAEAEQTQQDQDIPTEDFDQEQHDRILALLRERFSFVYPFEHISALPAKLSVSRLYPAVLDEADDAEEDWQNDPAFDELFVLPDSLSAKESNTAADRGTATHTFLQFCDFDRAKGLGVSAELDRMTAQRFITEDMAKLVSVKQLENFFQSALFSRLSSAKRVWREQRFNLFLPADQFTENAEKADLLKGETVAVQGVIDLFFEDKDGKIVLCDYKTDYLTKEELGNPALAREKLQARHGQQLSYYAKAIEAILGKYPDQILIYSLPLADSVIISV